MYMRNIIFQYIEQCNFLRKCKRKQRNLNPYFLQRKNTNIPKSLLYTL